MARPVKRRRICSLPGADEFGPCKRRGDGQVDMSLDEYETIRLIDYLGLSQEDCAARMNVARTTVQSIYDSARKKLSQLLVDSMSLRIIGGTYELCRHSHTCCKRVCQVQQLNYFNGGNHMIIAVTYENGHIFQHFGHCENFKIYRIKDKEIQSSEVVSAGGNGHGALAGFLKDLDVQILICGGIGGGARTALAEAGIQLYPGASGDADAAVSAMLNNTLNYDPDTTCNHHHHEGGHTCQGHTCS